MFNYHLKDATDSSVVSITVFDKQHAPIKTLVQKQKNLVIKLIAMME